MDKKELFAELEDTLTMVDEQIDEIVELAKTMGIAGEGIRPSQVRNADGSFMLSPLLVSRAHVLAGMALLEEVLGDGEEEFDEPEELEVNQHKATLDGLLNSVEPKQDPKMWMHGITGDCIYSEEPDNLMLARNYIRPKGQTFTENDYPSLFAIYGNTRVPRGPFDRPRTFQIPKETDLQIKLDKD